ncbi:putative serine esterase-domain-containing protein [Catenaria anguillulae PL171]|uniref:Putative serine esterase-domain-containing protein n=1 Tax=Catenaria anguillulae PL171 TaxID=765915 RepID=A0A1Y2HS69_9FUNG|nr:putative serine esterase-domain-containing protein [Catenaria anguillulae PL171]
MKQMGESASMSRRKSGWAKECICWCLYGNSSHVRFVVDTMADKHPDLVVLNCSSYGVTLTLDGIDVCGERMIREIMEFKRQCHIRKISFLGYSLGGLIIRYAAGRLLQSGFFDAIEPMNFITMATPHLGIISQRAYVTSLILFRTGLQGTLNDTEYSAPLLWVLTDPNMPFMQALKLFPHIYIAANVVGDRTVPYLTASAQLVNPYDTCPPVPLDPSNPVIVRPASDPPPAKRGMEALKAQAETAARMTVFLAVIVPILVVAWTVLGPVGVYQARQAQARHAKSDIKHAGVELSAEDRRKLEALALEVKTLPGAQDEWQRRIAQTLEEELKGKMTRVDVWLGEWRHTHAIIVVRKPSVAMHREGIPAVEHIAGLFKS